jgi:Domain of unknown function (DUF4189)
MKLFKGIAAVAALTFLIPLHALAAGAIAVDDENNEFGYGWVIGKTSMEEASNAAMAECFEGGNKSCRVATRFERCGAYAASWRFSNAGSGATKAEAISNALRNCKDCKIVVADCETNDNVHMTSTSEAR